MRQSLLHSDKERAENVMIVDLLRNDLGKSCQAGSIRVPKLCALESFANVHHLVSTVVGRLAADRDALDLLRGCFPGGSITGAPKQRAMQIIEELEPHRRAIYCGSIAAIGYDGSLRSSITIRTLLCQRGTVHVWGGGGIVADSSCDAEYQESLAKIDNLCQELNRHESPRELRSTCHACGRVAGSCSTTSPARVARRSRPTLNPDDVTAGLISRENKRESAILMPIVQKADELEIILTWRSAHLRSHAGQVSFPGGRVDESDASREHTALRETEEEIGIPMNRVQVLGRMGDYYTQSGYSITPVVGLIDTPVELRPNPHEVAAIIEAPLHFFLDSAAYRIHQRETDGTVRSFYSVTYGDYFIWAPPAAMLVEFYRAAGGLHGGWGG
jgi:8-oxo-dGTP pyrophosphatase MutT (NUDIX family)